MWCTSAPRLSLRVVVDGTAFLDRARTGVGVFLNEGDSPPRDPVPTSRSAPSP